MATLTETAYYARKAVNWGIIGLIGLIVIRVLFNFTLDTIRRAFPAPPLRVNNALGRLPRLTFPNSSSPSGKLTFSLQTVTGTLPEASEAARIYFLPKNKANFSSLQRAQTMVGRIGFTATPAEINPTFFRWQDPKNPLRTMEMDTVNNHFTLVYSYIHDLPLFAEKQIPSPEQGRLESEVLLQTLGLKPADLDSSKTQVRYLKLVGDQLTLTTSQSQADAAEVHLYRKDYDGMPVWTDRSGGSFATFILSGTRRTDQRFLSVDFRYWSIDTRTQGVYKLKTVTQAYNELENGQAYFALFSPGQLHIKITNVYLAYYDSVSPQLFLQPIFVFEGDPNFMAFVPAVAPPWTEE